MSGKGTWCWWWWTWTRTYFSQQQALVLLSVSINVMSFNIDVVVMINGYHHLIGRGGRQFIRELHDSRVCRACNDYNGSTIYCPWAMGTPFVAQNGLVLELQLCARQTLRADQTLMQPFSVCWIWMYISAPNSFSKLKVENHQVGHWLILKWAIIYKITLAHPTFIFP